MSRLAPLPADLLERRAGEAARRIALAELERAGRARAALAAGGDPEALHDFRVALRRLRSHLRAFRAETADAVGGKLARRLRRLAAATNPGRDAEVGMALLGELARATSPATQRAAAALSARLAARRDAVYARLDDELLPAFDELAGRLGERLGTWHFEVRLDGEGTPPDTFVTLLAAETARHAAALLDALAAAREARQGGDGGDARALHRARIEAKRLRYLLEPLTPVLAAARPPVKRLRRLQDLLGGARDLDVLADELASAAAEAESARVAAAAAGRRPAASPGGRTGRRALARELAARRAALARELDSSWLAAQSTEAAALAAELARLAPAPEAA